MNSYGDGNTYRGIVCKDSKTPTIMTKDGKTAYGGKDYPEHTNGPWEADATHKFVVELHGDLMEIIDEAKES